MNFISTPLDGAFVIEPEPVRDDRGFFVRTFCEETFRAHGLDPHVAQCSFSSNRSKGTLRGLHFQSEPHGESKLVRCTRGAIYDVIVELRTGRWFAVELSAANGRMLFVPPGVAHGFQTLEDDTDVAYQISKGYEAAAASGIRWDDPSLRIPWPLAVSAISRRDLEWPHLTI